MKDVPFAVSKPTYVTEKKKENEKQNLMQQQYFKTQINKNENSYLAWNLGYIFTAYTKGKRLFSSPSFSVLLLFLLQNILFPLLP